MDNVRNHLIQWLDEIHIYPRIVGEIDDGALMKAFGQGWRRYFYCPLAQLQLKSQNNTASA